MAWKTIAQIRLDNNLSSSFTDEQIETARLVSEAQIFSCLNTTSDQTDPTIVLAHSCLTAFHVLSGAMQLDAAGAYKSVQDTASALDLGMQNVKFSPKELQPFVDSFFQKAKILLAGKCDLQCVTLCSEKTEPAVSSVRHHKPMSYKPKFEDC